MDTLHIQCCTSSVATASVDCHVRQFRSDRTRQITSSAVGNFLGRNICVHANAWISCNTIVQLCPVRGPRVTCGPVEGFVRPN